MPFLSSVQGFDFNRFIIVGSKAFKCIEALIEDLAHEDSS
jgi:hypothetical protein